MALVGTAMLAGIFGGQEIAHAQLTATEFIEYPTAPEVDCEAWATEPSPLRLAWGGRIQAALKAAEPLMVNIATHDFGRENGASHFFYALFNGLTGSTTTNENFQGTVGDMRLLSAHLWSNGLFAYRIGTPISFVGQWASLLALETAQRFLLEQHFPRTILLDEGRSQSFAAQALAQDGSPQAAENFAAYYYQRVLLPLQTQVLRTDLSPRDVIQAASAVLGNIHPEMRN